MKKSFTLFGTACIAVVLPLVIRLVVLLPLYTDANVRAQTQAALEHIADSEGLLLSGFHIVSFSDDSMRVSHRAHARGADTLRCFTVTLSHSTYSPCGA
ncbi:hypothetical protein COU78_00975 [Candidatus Peregrinibacteria bacterium CG10_big_fil_rev_8_21_14_0_10_49_24]|nr:MAG: hypothetical protein COV83_01225 [Candidatus Peregrinibacteria bacterium CG11_big_fil_rev_8_21_14_0_20_49_14]PIR51521.1 MAG: hypothetical protein COU78_00975 [Candidatus Peregrinibacteria bacterium CG10_big_fil_rev_8_21_14_0_10_49_24]PJA67836.1 MAG: hypothetical protein CO157_02365 [Candidatus Peregrinibacteria bacterium CG_4_9_14_3_um_filter_49_12]